MSGNMPLSPAFSFLIRLGRDMRDGCAGGIVSLVCSSISDTGLL
jgi:hypothetical protein